MDNKWLVNFRPNPEAHMRLFCFPYAGGVANIFRTWAEKLAPEIEVLAIQLPGHGTRIKETPYTRLSPTVNALFPNVHSLLDKPFALFGHSLGALMAYELAEKLSGMHVLPKHLIVSASKAPKQLANSGIHTLKDGEFIKKIKHLNGTPEAVFANQELLDLMMPVLRSDFAMAETYFNQEKVTLDCPISAFSGAQDFGNSMQEIEAWSSFTSNVFELSVFPGDHFFIQSEETAVLEKVKTSLLKSP